MNPLKFIKKLFPRKEEDVDFPPEFALVAFTKEARQYGIFEDMTKEIRHYEGKKYISKSYTKSLLNAMEELGVPTHNLEDGQMKIPIVKKISPEDVNYES